MATDVRSMQRLRGDMRGDENFLCRIAVNQRENEDRITT